MQSTKVFTDIISIIERKAFRLGLVWFVTSRLIVWRAVVTVMTW